MNRGWKTPTTTAIVGGVAGPHQARKHGRHSRSSEIVSLTIDRLSTGGAGIARHPSGRVVFVPQTAPGDVIEAEVMLDERPARGRIRSILVPSADRIVPSCSYASTCGGCDWMHLALPAQSREHEALVASAIAHAVPEATLPAIRVHAPLVPLAYRTRARLYMQGERRRARLGYRISGSHKLIAIDACPVLDPAIAPLLDDLPDVFAGASGEGDVRIARGRGERPVVDVVWRGEIADSTWTTIDARVAQGIWAGARVRLEGAITPASFGDPRPCLTGADGAQLVIAPGGFAQPSDVGAAQLARRVDELARLTDGAKGNEPLWKEAKPRHVLELFAGSGTLSVLLARETASFTAVELDAAAAACARDNLSARGIDAKIVTADADHYPIPPRTDLVVLDPPRTGADGAAHAIAASNARAVVYVACDPPTLARDLGVITRAGFTITHIETFELFPQTSHVETVVRLARVRGGSARNASKGSAPKPPRALR